MNTNTQCFETQLHRLYIRSKPRLNLCPFHAKLMLDACQTLGYSYKITRIKSTTPAFCEFRLCPTHSLEPTKPDAQGRSGWWSLHKQRKPRTIKPQKLRS